MFVVMLWGIVVAGLAVLSVECRISKYRRQCKCTFRHKAACSMLIWQQELGLNSRQVLAFTNGGPSGHLDIPFRVIKQGRHPGQRNTKVTASPRCVPPSPAPHQPRNHPEAARSALGQESAPCTTPAAEYAAGRTAASSGPVPKDLSQPPHQPYDTAPPAAFLYSNKG